MHRYAFLIEYNGKPFSGWQRQNNQPSVQGVIEKALAKLEPGLDAIAAAGRTDAGVHATGQVAHADMKKEWEPFRLSEALNYHLKQHPVAITACSRVSDDWHARFSATERRYVYKMVLRRAPLVHEQGMAWRVPREIDAQAMRKAAAYLVGKHDFTTFRSSMCQAKSPIKTMDEIEIEEFTSGRDRQLLIRLRARSFLHNQVRSIVGSLERVGAGSWPHERMREALAAKDRAACGPVAPPDGLFLASVSYNPEVFD